MRCQNWIRICLAFTECHSHNTQGHYKTLFTCYPAETGALCTQQALMSSFIVSNMAAVSLVGWQTGNQTLDVIVLIVNLDIIGENGSFPCCDGRHQSKDIGHLSDRLHCVFSMTHGDSLNCWLQLQSTQLWQLWSFLVYKHYAGLICIIGYFLTTVTLKGCMYHEFYR